MYHCKSSKKKYRFFTHSVFENKENLCVSQSFYKVRQFFFVSWESESQTTLKREKKKVGKSNMEDKILRRPGLWSVRGTVLFPKTPSNKTYLFVNENLVFFFEIWDVIVGQVHFQILV